MLIIRDTREQAGYSFDGPRYEGVTVEDGSLATGDYSVKGLEGLVACERKELGDLVHCLAQDRPRFVRELERARGMDAFMVVVEARWDELAGGKYRSRLAPHSACQSVISFMAKHRVPFLFVGSRAAGEYAVWSFLRQYLEGARKRLTAIVKAHGDEATSNGPCRIAPPSPRSTNWIGRSDNPRCHAPQRPAGTPVPCSTYRDNFDHFPHGERYG